MAERAREPLVGPVRSARDGELEDAAALRGEDEVREARAVRADDEPRGAEERDLRREAPRRVVEGDPGPPRRRGFERREERASVGERAVAAPEHEDRRRRRRRPRERRPERPRRGPRRRVEVPEGPRRVAGAGVQTARLRPRDRRAVEDPGPRGQREGLRQVHGPPALDAQQRQGLGVEREALVRGHEERRPFWEHARRGRAGHAREELEEAVVVVARLRRGDEDHRLRRRSLRRVVAGVDLVAVAARRERVAFAAAAAVDRRVVEDDRVGSQDAEARRAHPGEDDLAVVDAHVVVGGPELATELRGRGLRGSLPEREALGRGRRVEEVEAVREGRVGAGERDGAGVVAAVVRAERRGRAVRRAVASAVDAREPREGSSGRRVALAAPLEARVD